MTAWFIGVLLAMVAVNVFRAIYFYVDAELSERQAHRRLRERISVTVYTDADFRRRSYPTRPAPPNPHRRKSTVECHSCGAPVQPGEHACSYCGSTP